jgi:hypothetical protein
VDSGFPPGGPVNDQASDAVGLLQMFATITAIAITLHSGLFALEQTASLRVPPVLYGGLGLSGGSALLAMVDLVVRLTGHATLEKTRLIAHVSIVTLAACYLLFVHPALATLIANAFTGDLTPLPK